MPKDSGPSNNSIALLKREKHGKRKYLCVTGPNSIYIETNYEK
jgi:hypothetical protein